MSGGKDDPVHQFQRDRRNAGLNTVSFRSFRDTADRDYVAARACFGLKLRQQSFWFFHQA